jgi:hypothetical protein
MSFRNPAEYDTSDGVADCTGIKSEAQEGVTQFRSME